MAFKKPNRRHRQENRKRGHLFLLLIILSFIVYKKIEKTFSHKPISAPAILLQASFPVQIVNTSKSKKSLRLNHVAALIQLLLIHDIHPNPGPVSNMIFTCNTCNKTTEIQVQRLCNIRQNFEWICPNKSCPPNHTDNFIPPVGPTPFLIEPESYEETNEDQTRATTNHKLDNPPLTPEEEENYQLIKVLPNISPTDYAGKDLCRRCYKSVKQNQRAILCDICLQWIHLKCSDVSIKTYNHYKTLNNFPWICNVCRIPEDFPHNQTFDYESCKTEDLPESWASLKKKLGKDEEIFLHFNARSAVNKSEEIQEICYTLKPALVLLSETWFDHSCPKGTSVPEGYSILRKDRSDRFKQIYGKTNGGGVSILVRKGLNVKIHGTMNKDDNEILWCTLLMKSKQYLIGLIYRASYTKLLNPDENGETELENMLQASADYDVILMGDTNCDTSNPHPSKDTKTMLKVAEEYSLEQIINKPTRFNDKSSTIIDHIYMRNTKNAIKSGTCDGISDHCGIYFTMKVEKTNFKETKRLRSFKNFNEEDFQRDLIESINRSTFKSHILNRELNKAFDVWLKILQEISNLHAPWKEFQRKTDTKYIPWYTKELEDLKEQKNRYLNLYRLFKNPDDLQTYKKMKNLQTHLTRSLKRTYYKNKIDEYDGDSKKIWQLLKDVTNLNYKEETLPDNLNKNTANKFNHFFSTVGKSVQKKLKINIQEPNLNQDGSFKFHNITEGEISKLIKRIRPDVATGYDEISSRLLKAAEPAILPHLKDLVNLSYETETFPDSLKRANVKILYKSGDNNNPADYRPISILTTLSKIFERSAVNQLMDFLINNNKLNFKQHAYKPKFSTATCLFELVENIRKLIDQKHLVAIASLDLSKAFDSLAHELILNKLIKQDIDHKAVKWVKSYLEDRKQCVKFGDIISDEEYVRSGVPQGSILGPLLFIICTDDLPEVLKEYETYTYADDTQIVVTGKNKNEIETNLTDAINKANTYYNENSLLNNIGKTEILLFQNHKQKHVKIQVKVRDGPKIKIIEGQESMKILGIYLDKHLTWNKHISQTKKKATNSIRNLHRVNKFLPLKQKRLLYNSLVVPHFSYCDVIWNELSRENERKLQLTQNFAAKSMLGLRKTSSATMALKRLELLPLKEKRNIHSAVLVKKALDGQVPQTISSRYTDLQRHPDLRPGNLQIPKHNTSQYEKGPLYTSIKVWNNVPDHLKNLKLNQFKDNLQKHELKNFLKS